MKKSFYRYADRTKQMSGSVIREILKVTAKPNIISFAGGLPAPETFPTKRFERAVKKTIRVDGTKALQYTITEGHLGLRLALGKWLRKQKIKAPKENILLSHGSQQGLDLVGKIFLSPGDSILTEDPTYLGAIQCLNAYQTKYVTVPMDEKGLDPKKVEAILKKKKVKFIYVVPTFHNPAGVTMPLERRKKLIQVAKKYRTPIIEDDPYGILRFKGKSLPSLYSLANGKGVIYLSTFSKLLSPGIRLGFILAEKEVMSRLVLAKQATDLQTNTFIQYAVYHYCQNGDLDRHIPNIIRDYARRAKVMIQAMKKYFPPEAQFVEPEGGMFVWVRLPQGMKASLVFQKALKKKVAFVDGRVFYANGGGENCFRLNFTRSTDAEIKEGIKRLGGVLSSLLQS